MKFPLFQIKRNMSETRRWPKNDSIMKTWQRRKEITPNNFWVTPNPWFALSLKHINGFFWTQIGFDVLTNMESFRIPFIFSTVVHLAKLVLRERNDVTNFSLMTTICSIHNLLLNLFEYKRWVFFERDLPLATISCRSPLPLNQRNRGQKTFRRESLNIVVLAFAKSSAFFKVHVRLDGSLEGVLYNLVGYTLTF